MVKLPKDWKENFEKYTRKITRSRRGKFIKIAKSQKTLTISKRLAEEANLTKEENVVVLYSTSDKQHLIIAIAKLTDEGVRDIRYGNKNCVSPTISCSDVIQSLNLEPSKIYKAEFSEEEQAIIVELKEEV